MLTKFNFSNDMSTVASDMINAYISNGYKIDAHESVITSDDKDCTFKAVLKKNVDGAECKTIITLTDNGDDNNKHCTYRKVDLVGDTKWGEETRTFSSSTDKAKLNSAVKNHVLDNICKTPNMWWDHADNDFIDYYHDTVRKIFKDFGLHCDWFGDEFSDRKKRLDDANKPTTDDKKTPVDSKQDTDKKDTKCEFKCPSVFTTLDDYIKLNNEDESTHIKVNADDTEQDLYNKIVSKREEHKKVSKTNDENKMSDAADKTKHSTSNKKTDDLPKQDPDDEIEDSLIRLIRYIYNEQIFKLIRDAFCK